MAGLEIDSMKYSADSLNDRDSTNYWNAYLIQDTALLVDRLPFFAEYKYYLKCYLCFVTNKMLATKCVGDDIEIFMADLTVKVISYLSPKICHQKSVTNNIIFPTCQHCHGYHVNNITVPHDGSWNMSHYEFVETPLSFSWNERQMFFRKITLNDLLVKILT